MVVVRDVARALFVTFTCLVFFLPQAKAEEKLHVPTSAWLVGPASIVALSDKDTKYPCVMANQFDNGYFFRFSATDKKILALAIDFRQGFFNAGNYYDLSVELDSSFSNIFSSAAYDRGTLILNLSEQDGFYEKLVAAEEIKIKFEREQRRFSLVGIKEGLNRTARCYDPSKRSSVQKHAKQQDRSTKEKTQKSEPQKQAAKINTQKPSKAETKSVFEEIQKAVEGVPSEHILQVDDENQFSGPEQSWTAKKGGSLRKVINIWASHIGVSLVWMANQDFYLQEPLAIQGNFTKALRESLSQFSDFPIHPVGRLYSDPQTKQPVLLIKSDSLQ